MKMYALSVLLGFLLLQGVLGDDGTTTQAMTIEEVAALEKKNAAEGVYDQDGTSFKSAQAASVLLDNGKVDRDEGADGGNDPHKGGMEEILQELQKEVESGDVLPPGDVADEIETIAAEYANGTRTGSVGIEGTVLEVTGETDGGTLYQKRQAVSRSSRWAKGIVPWSFKHKMSGESILSEAAQKNTKKAFAFYEKHTCLKFPEWTSTLNAELGRTEPYFLRFISPDEGGCWSFVGMGAGYRTDNGQAISPCNGVGVAAHEIGHAIGFAHEQNRGDRYFFVKMYPENADAKHKGTFNGAPNTGLELVHPYDLGSIMHYGRYGFSYNGLPTLDAIDPENVHLIGNKEDTMSHYDLMGITNYYDCTDSCPADKKALKCQNDAYVDNTCKCECPWMFGGDLCEKLKQPDALREWPAGAYGIVQTANGCPGTTGWKTGSRAHAMDGSATNTGASSTMSVAKPVTGTLSTDYFCMRDAAATSTTEWPQGIYCIYQSGDTCPAGFTSGWLFFDDSNDKAQTNTVEGSLPKGEYGNDTKYYYCCRDDGYHSTPITLPNKTPFILPRHGGYCQSVKNMGVVGYEMRYDLEDTNTQLSSQAPIPNMGTWYSDYWMRYCYYYQIEYDCGGEITLTNANPSQNILTPNYPNNYDNAKECLWYVKGPVGQAMVVDFNDFDVQADSNGNCIDSVEVRHTLIAQPGERYCGNNAKTSFISDAGFTMLIFRTDYSGQGRGFNATVRIVTKAEQCYDTADKGATYRGKVDYSEHYWGCMPWEEVQHCDVKAFDDQYKFSGLVGHNHCRNPNGLLRPWCYINKYCEVDHCDVCMAAKCFDYHDNCDELMATTPNLCDTKDGFQGCHKTCKKCGTNFEFTVKNCPRPTKLMDKNSYIVAPADTKATFEFGEKLTLKCKNVPMADRKSRELTCGSDGKFEGEQLFCGAACPDGYEWHRDSCYKLDLSAKVLPAEAITKCKEDGATIVSIRSKGENDIVQKVAKGNWVWIGYSDMNRDKKWVWEDGSDSAYTNWKTGAPDNNHWDICTSMSSSDGQWHDSNCDHYPKYVVCRIDRLPFNDEEDYYCQDESTQCFPIIQRNYKLCSDWRDYAHVYCRRSCGICPALECRHPGTAVNAVTSETAEFIGIGKYVEYTCNAGYELSSGHLGRACLREGNVTGQPAQCKPEAEFDDTYGFRPISRSKTDGAKMLVVYNATDALIGREGQALRWEIYSHHRSVVMAQVWRPTAEANKFKLIGQSWITLHPRRVNVYTLKSFERFTVQKGDMMGWYAPIGKGVTYSDCSDEYSTTRIAHALKVEEMSSVKVDAEFTVPEVDKCRTYSVRIVVGKGSEATAINVASQKYGAKCLDASSNKDICQQVLDGDLAPYDGSWVSNNEGKGAFIKIGFNAAYNIIGARFMQRFAKSGQNKKATLTFSDASTQQIGFNERRGTSHTDINGMEWDSYDLKPVSTDSVTVTVDSVYSQDNNGFIEIEFYGVCMKGWVSRGDYCYKIDTTNRGYEDAEKNCAATPNAHLASVENEEENAYLTELARAKSLGDLFIGKNDIATEGTFVWTDGSTSGFTKWKSGEPSSRDCTWIRVSSATWMTVHCTWYPRASACKRKNDIQTTLPYTLHGNEVIPRSKKDWGNEIGDVIIEESAAMKIQKSGSIMAWKLYSDAATEITMMVVRPVAGKDMTYTVVGQNTVRTQAGRTAIIDVPEFARIMVETGDYVAWSYIPTENPPLQYTSCSTSQVTMRSVFYDRSSSQSLADGDTFTGRHNTWNGCRVYSVGYFMNEVQPIDVNVASLKRLSTCTGASSSASICNLAIDGVLRPWDSAWTITENTGVGAWMTIQFPSTYALLGGRVMQNFNKNAQIKGLDFDLGNNKKQEVTLFNRQGSSDLDYKVQVFDTFSIDPPIETNSVKVTVKSTYTDGYVGLVDIELYSKGCPAGWIRDRSNCYKYFNTQKLYYGDDGAANACKALGATVSSVQDQAENAFLNKLSGGNSIYIGYQLYDKKTWKADDETTAFTYTNWKSGEPNGADNSEYCIAINPSGQWQTEWCQWHYPKQYICKKPMLGDSTLSVTTHGNPALPRDRTDGSGSVGEIYIERTDSMKVPLDGSIQGWKLYTRKSVELIMMVVRPVAGNEAKYTIVGENTVKTPAGKTDIITIPEIFRINAKAGDYIAWYFLPDSQEALPYDSCSQSTKPTKHYWVDRPSGLTVGQEITTKLNTWYSCRTYSISYLLNKKTADNGANVAKGAQCTASTSPTTCSMALDSRLYAYDSAWVSQGEHVGAWFEINLDGRYPILGGRLQQRYASASRFTEVTFTFDDGSKQMVKFGARTGSSQTDYVAQAWDAFSLTAVTSQKVKATVTASASTEDVGIIELELISTGCREGYSLFNGYCYWYSGSTSKDYYVAEADCVSKGGHLTTIADADENNFVQSLSNGDIHLGIRYKDSAFVGIDGSTVTYTNWKSGEPSSNAECVYMYTAGNWDDRSCSSRAYVCKSKRKGSEAPSQKILGNLVQPRSKTDGTSSLRELRTERTDTLKVPSDGNIAAWRLYTLKAVELVMYVVRPVAGSDVKYTIVGQNTVKTVANRVSVIPVDEMFRVSAKAGDYIAWFYLVGSENALTWGSCSQSDKPTKYQYYGKESEPWYPGSEVTVKTGSWYSCRTYSVGYVLSTNALPAVSNLAKGSSCTASSSAGICELAVDGGLFAYDSAWVAQGGKESWLQVTLDGKYKLAGGRIQQRYATASRITEIEFTFDGDVKQKVTFGARIGESQTDYGAQAWDEFVLTPVLSQIVKATVTGTTATEDVGIVEIELFTKECPDGWTTRGDYCYWFSGTEKKNGVDSEAACVAKGAHTAWPVDAAENDYIKSLTNGDVFLGIRKVNNNWLNLDGSSMSYTRWSGSEPNGGSDVTCVYQYGSGTWDDRPCTSNTVTYLCKKSNKVVKTVAQTVVGERAGPRTKGAGNLSIFIADKAANRFTKDGTVTAWKVYGRGNGSAVMQVWRGVAGTNPKEFKLIGANTVPTEAGRTSYAHVPGFAQIVVKAGDVIGVQTPGGDSTVAWDYCDASKVTMVSYKKTSGWSFPQPGDTLTPDTTGDCRSYSVAAVVGDVKQPVTVSNIAGVSAITTCEASVNSDTCGKAIDNNLTPPDGEWKTTGAVVGSWIKLNFNDVYKVKFISIAQRFGFEGQSLKVKLDFSDSTSETVTLSPRTGGSFTQQRNGYWDDFELSKEVETNFVKFTTEAVQTESENGYVEIRVWASCPKGWFRFGKSCYFKSTEKLHFFQAKDKCTALSAILARVDSKAENTFLISMEPKGTFRIGFRDNYKTKPEQVWAWEDGGPVTYTNWHTGKPSNNATWGYCAYAGHYDDGTWYDAYCKWYNEVPYICQKNAPGVITTSRRDTEVSPPPPMEDDTNRRRDTDVSTPPPPEDNNRLKRSGRLLRLMERINQE